MGDYTITLTRDETENFLKIEDALSFDYDRYECTPEEVAKRFAGSPIVRLCNAIIPATLGQEDLEEVFTWARSVSYTHLDVYKRQYQTITERIELKRRINDNLAA